MGSEIEVTPTAGASTNPLGITFGASATIEFAQVPKNLLNKDVTGIELTKVDLAGAHLHKGPLNALIPWANMISFVY